MRPLSRWRGFFILTALERPQRAVPLNKAREGGVFSSPLRPPGPFDSTKGFPGEGPSRPELAFLNTWQGIDHEWSRQAQAILAGTAAISDVWFHQTMSDNEIHLALLALVQQGNSKNPIAARFQTQPDRVERLLGPESDSTRQAHSGTAYSFTTRPFQYRRPRPIPLRRDQRRAAVEEIERLMTECPQSCDSWATQLVPIL